MIHPAENKWTGARGSRRNLKEKTLSNSIGKSSKRNKYAILRTNIKKQEIKTQNAENKADRSSSIWAGPASQ